MEALNNVIPELDKPFKLDKPEIKECYIAYLDILGYRAFFKENPDMVDGLLSTINICIETVVRRLNIMNNLLNVDNRFNVRVFSDNILIYYECDNGFTSKFVLITFIELIKDIQIMLITNYSIFLRGGITKGKFASNEMFVFGQGLIDAVVLEEKKAKNPRIVIDEKVIEDINDKTQFKNPYICKLCKELKAISGLFITSSNRELVNRLFKAYQTFDTIIAAVPNIYCDAKTIEEIRKSFGAQANQIKLYQSHPKVLEQNYQSVKRTLPNISRIFEKLVNDQMSQFEKQNDIRAKNAYFIDDDGYATVDYLNVPDVSSAFSPQIVEQAIENIKSALPQFPEIVEEIKINIDKSKKDEFISHLLLRHKRAVSIEIADCMKKYQESKDKAVDFSDLDKVIKKYIWSMKYHNLASDKSGHGDLKINSRFDYNISCNFTIVEILE